MATATTSTTTTETTRTRSQGRPTGGLRAALCERDGWACVWCGAWVLHASEFPAGVDESTVAKLRAELDHIEVFSSGGTWAPENLLCSCGSCNHRRGATPIDTWITQLAVAQVPGLRTDPEVRRGRSAVRAAYRAEISRRLGRSLRAALQRVARSPRFSEEARNQALRILATLTD